MRHKCIHCPRVIASKFVVCLTCRKKKKAWVRRNKDKVRKSERRWRKANPDKIKASKLRYRKKHPKKVKAQIQKCWKQNYKKYKYNNWRRWLKTRYGISEVEFLAVLEKQKGKCAICQSKQLCGKRRKLYIDHCHKNDTLRGLLCFRCNTLLGMAQDKISILLSAAKYLKEAKWLQK